MQAIQNHPTFVHHTMIAGPCQAANVVGHTTAHRLFLQPVLVVFAVLLLLAASTLQGFAQTSCGQDGGQGDVVKQLPARNSKVQSPFDRVMAPYLANLKGKAKPGHNVAELPASTANAVVGGTSLNFPGFVSAPTLQLAPANGCGTLLVSVSGDFNNDGNLDIATVQADGTVKMILNPGPGGSLATAKPLTPDSSYTVNNSSILYLATADLNGDGNLDLVGQDVVHDQFVVWLGNGDGTFQNSIAYSVTPTSNASWFLGGGFFVIADFNGDGFPDIATVELEFFSGTVTEQTFLNDGKGNFTPGSESSASVGSFISAGIGQGDIVSNGSAPTGIAFAVENSSGLSILVIHSNGDGTFTSAVAPAAALVPDYYFTAKGSLYATNLTANFAGAPLIAGKSGKGPLPHNTVGSGIPTTDIVFITGDGAVYDVPYTEQGVSYDPTTINVLAGTDTQNLSAYPNPLRPSSAKMRGNDSTVSSSSDPIPYEQFLNLADMNGDGTLDLVLYSYGAIYVYLNSGTGSFTAPPAQVATGINGYSEPQPGNFDGLTYTANPSIVGVDYQFDSLSVYAGNGAGQFYAAPLVGGASTNGGGSYTALGGNITVVATGDVNGDGLQDVIAYDWTNAATATNQGYPDVVVGINNGGKPQANETANFTFTTALSAADFKNDNGSFIEPVTFASPSGGLSMLVSATGALGVMTATKGVFGAPMWIINLSYLHCPFTFADAGDVNGDGITDIVVTYPGDASCGSSGGYPSGYFTFIGASDGTYNQWYFAAFGSSLFQPRLIDIDNNGALDLVLSDQDFNNDVFGVYTVPNMSDGSGLFDLTKAAQQAQNYIVSDIIPGDYNSDGKQDLTLATEGQFNYANPSAFIQPATEGVLLLPGNGDFSFGLPTLVNSGYFAQWGSYADFNGDGAPDLALAEYGVSPDGGDEGILLATPIAQILPNLGGGNFGPAIVLNDGLFDFNDFDSPRNQVNSLTHQIYTFTGNFGNSGGNDLLISGSYATAEFINQGQSTLALTASPSSANQGQEVTLTATVTSPVNPFPATGTVSFFSGGVLIGAAPLDGTGAAKLSITQLSVGGDIITASYSGDSNHNSSTGTATVTISALASDTLTVSASPTSSVQGQPVILTATIAGTGATSPTGMVTFNNNGAFLGAAQLSGGSASLTTSQLPAGSDTVTASYAGDTNNGASSATVTVTISALIADTMTLTASPTSAAQGQGVVLTATIAGTGAAPPTGMVTFTNNGALLGAAELSGSSASFTTSQLSVGSNAITSSYVGDANYSLSSGTVTVTVAAVDPGFTVSTSNGSLSLVQGATGAVILSIAANTTFSGAITFSCSGAPSEATCGVNPGSLTLIPGQTGTASVVIATTPPNNSYQAEQHHRSPWSVPAGGVALTGVGLLLWPRRRQLTRLRVLLIAFGIVIGLGGCGGSSKAPTQSTTAAPTYAGTPVGSSTLTVEVTNGIVTQTQTIALTVTAAK